MITKRIFLASMLLGLLAATTGAVRAQTDTIASPATPRASEGGVLDILTRTVQFDVALDCRTWRFNQGVSNLDFGRGDSFIANGKIFPVGTLPSGGQSNDPNSPGSIGDFIETGIMAATLAEIMAGKRPAFIADWLLLLTDGGGLIAQGPHPDLDPMAVVGGKGRFSNARGELFTEIIGTNVSGCPNLRLTFKIKRR